jgi:hypothetical protein
MGVREALNKRPGVAAAVGGVLIVGAVAYLLMSNSGTPSRASSAYYSDDDGKSFFADDIDKVAPFDRNGKQAHRAFVYRCGGDKPFVAYLGRHTEGARNKISQLRAKSDDAEAAGQITQLLSSGLEVRKPGQSKWVPLLSAEGEAIAAHPKCPDGTTASGMSP